MSDLTRAGAGLHRRCALLHDTPGGGLGQFQVLPSGIAPCEPSAKSDIILFHFVLQTEISKGLLL
jgi:hypothetical protein